MKMSARQHRNEMLRVAEMLETGRAASSFLLHDAAQT